MSKARAIVDQDRPRYVGQWSIAGCTTALGDRHWGRSSPPHPLLVGRYPVPLYRTSCCSKRLASRTCASLHCGTLPLDPAALLIVGPESID